MRVEIAFGVGFDANGKRLPDVEVWKGLQCVLGKTATMFGGCTILDGQGAWIDPAGTLVMEASKVLVVNLPPTASRLTSDLDEQIQELAEFVRKTFRQTAVNVSKVVASSYEVAQVVG